jgi:CBS domain-containing protein
VARDPDTPARALVSTRGIVTIAPDATLGEAAREMQRRGVGWALVMDAEERFLGIVTERDLLRAVAASRHPDQCRVDEWMTADAITIGPDTTRDEAAAIMQERGFRHLPVLEDGRVIGVVSIRSLV